VAARGLIVCEMESWETSYGIGVEIAAFKKAGKPIVHMLPGQVPDELRVSFGGEAFRCWGS
jgi:hypothetical protein